MTTLHLSYLHFYLPILCAVKHFMTPAHTVLISISKPFLTIFPLAAYAFIPKTLRPSSSSTPFMKAFPIVPIHSDLLLHEILNTLLVHTGLELNSCKISSSVISPFPSGHILSAEERDYSSASTPCPSSEPCVVHRVDTE